MSSKSPIASNGVFDVFETHKRGIFLIATRANYGRHHFEIVFNGDSIKRNHEAGILKRSAPHIYAAAEILLRDHSIEKAAGQHDEYATR